MKPHTHFPTGAFANVTAWRTQRWRQEAILRTLMQENRQRIYKLTGQKEDPTFLEAGVRYAPMADGFDAIWRIIEQSNGWSAETLAECRKNADVGAALHALGLGPVSLESIGMCVRSAEFTAYRNDTTFLRCLAAERKAFEMLPQVIATSAVRDHNYWQAIRKRETMREIEAGLVDRTMEHSLTVDDLDTALERFEKEGK